MRTLWKLTTGQVGPQRRRSVALATALAVTAAAALAPPALAKKAVNHEFDEFAQCPITVSKLLECVYATATGGEFHIGSKTVTVNMPIILQGGVVAKSETLAPAANGETLSKTPLTIPGGLVGVAGLGGEVTATTELVGPVSLSSERLLGREGVATELPIRVKLENPLLGNECYIGSALEPITLRLTTGTTAPPAPNEPISGSRGAVGVKEEGQIETLEGVSLVDNSFAAPGVNGCGEGLAPVLDPAVDLSAGLPSTAGHNTAILDQNIFESPPKYVKKSHVIPKEE